MSASTPNLAPMSVEEKAASLHDLKKTIVRNVIIVTVVKGAILYGLHRWAKSLKES